MLCLTAANLGESIQPPTPPRWGEAPRGRGDGCPPLSLRPRLANKQDAAAALLPCELIERLSLERLVNENRSPCRIVSAGLPRRPRPPPPPAALTLPLRPQEPCVAKRGHPAGPARATLQGLRWLLRTAPAAPPPPPAAAPPPAAGPRAARARPPARRWVRGSVCACPLPRSSPPYPHNPRRALAPPGTRCPPGRMPETVRGRRGRTVRCGPSAASSPW